MKKFKFRLEGLLKLREFKEHKAKIELGQVNKKISEVKIKIAELKNNLLIGNQSQEEVLTSKGGSKGRMLYFFPYFERGIMAHIDKLKGQQRELENSYQQKLTQLHKLKGEVEVIDKLKQKEKKIYLKKINKKIEEDIQDTILMRRNFKETMG